MLVKKPAWHGLGTILDAPPTAAEAIFAAGLDWIVTKEPLFTKEGVDENVSAPILQKAPDHYALIRSCDRKILGVAGKRYVPLQNIEAFDFFNPFLDKGVATLETAGSLQGGKIVWVLAKLNGFEADVVKDDPVQAYLLLSNPHTGNGAARVLFTPTRVVCWNTLRAAEEGAKNSVKIVHSKNLTSSLATVQQTVDVTSKTFTFSLDHYRAMARKEISVVGLKNYVRKVLEVPDKVRDMPRAWEGIEAAFDAGPGADIPGVGGTVWNAYNSITYWIDHMRSRSNESRLKATWFGAEASKIRRLAHNAAMTLVNNN